MSNTRDRRIESGSDEKQMPSSPKNKNTLESMNKGQLINLVGTLESQNRINEKVIELYQNRLSFYKNMNKKLAGLKPISESEPKRSARRLTNLKS